MIKTENGKVTLQGSIPELLTDVTMTCKAIKESIIADGENEETAKACLQKSLDLAFMSEKDLDMELIKLMAMMAGLKGLV
mgnify:CR=1 FL=1